ncbi:hypothetical protein [Paracoccus sp. KR1-242]|uniref:hypothetical protein n=1 Tax=Paracoccus sp. KR1-242 TaxID=3410028 RepID=UPI003C0EA327
MEAAHALSAARKADEASRLAAIQDAGAIPEECGPDILASPARGGFVLHRNIELLSVGTHKVEAVHRGYGGRSAIRRADVFDVMVAAALRAKRPLPLTPGQISMARRYAAMVEVAASDGMRLSSLDASHGGGDSMGWMDRHLSVAEELSVLRSRIGGGVAMAVRRVRPSARGDGQRGPILDRVLVDMVCLKGRTLDQVLVAHGWSVKGEHRKAVAHALAEALDRMIGYRAKKSS